MAHLAAACLALTFACLSAAWALTNPPEASPDEPAAVVKALATGDLQVRGQPHTAPYAPYDGSTLNDVWIAKATRAYRVPASQVPTQLSPCMAGHPELSASCQQPARVRPAGIALAVTPDGVYPPVLYLPLGLAARLGSTPDRADYLARGASVLLCTGLLGLAAWCSAWRRRSAWPVAGLLLALTPMALFLAGSVTTNGVEVAAATCMWAGVLRSTDSRAPGVAWVAAGTGALVMTAARQLDVVWLAAALAVHVVLLGGPSAWWRSMRAAGRPAFVAGVAAASGAAFCVSWDLLATPRQSISLATASAGLPGWRDVEALVHEAVGVFGWLDTSLPDTAERAWAAAVGALVLVSLVACGRRARVAVLVAVVALVAGELAMATLVLAQIGYGMQSRYVLPMAVGVVLVSSEVLDGRRRVRRLALPVVAGVAVLVAVVHLVALDTNLVRYGVGLGSGRSVWSHPSWVPPGGRLPGGALVMVALTALAVAVISVLRAGARAPHRAPPEPAPVGRG